MKKFGFTLVEVLVTLSIVGVIAALTIPSLAMNAQKKYWANALAVKISDFETSVKNAMIVDNANDIYDTVFFKDVPQEEVIEKIKCFESFGDVLPLRYYYEKIYKIDTKDSFVDPWNYTFLNLKNGGTIFIKQNYNGYIYYKYSEQESIENGTFRTDAMDIYIDVNGKKLPNTIGRDIFSFVLDENGKLHARGSQSLALFLEKPELHWKTACSDTNKGSGIECTGRLVENNFVMDY